MTAWYDLPPKEYARGLCYAADRSDESAGSKEAEGKSWSRDDAARYRRQARRLRAIATLCDRSDAAKAGTVDFLGLSDPAQSREAEMMAIAKAEAMLWS
jgi:hypothetical protein